MDNQINTIKHHSSICYNCIWARKPASDENRDKGYVGCAYFVSIEDHSDNRILSTIIEAEEVAEGWVDLRASVFGEKSGIITNLQILTKNVKSCTKFEEKIKQ